MGVQVNRLQRDAKLSVSHVFPAAAANVNTASIDLGLGPYRTDDVMVHIQIPALAAYTDNTKSIITKIQDSADNSSFADINPQVTTTTLGVASTGTPLTDYYFRLPATVRQFIQINIACLTGGADITALSLVAELTF